MYDYKHKIIDMASKRRGSESDPEDEGATPDFVAGATPEQHFQFMLLKRIEALEAASDALGNRIDTVLKGHTSSQVQTLIDRILEITKEPGEGVWKINLIETLRKLIETLKK